MDNQKINHLIRENKNLEEQNQILKQSLEELIAVNTELTESIQSFSSNNQNELDRIHELEEQNRTLKNQLIKQSQTKMNQAHLNQSKINEIEELKNENAEMSNFIKQIVESSKNAKMEYDKEIQMLKNELEHSRQTWRSQIAEIENKYREKIEDYEITISNLRTKIERSNQNLQNQVLKQSIQLQNDGIKNLKVSTTIQDLRNLYEKQLHEKQRTITVYVNLLKSLKEKIRA